MYFHLIWCQEIFLNYSSSIRSIKWRPLKALAKSALCAMLSLFWTSRPFSSIYYPSIFISIGCFVLFEKIWQSLCSHVMAFPGWIDLYANAFSKINLTNSIKCKITSRYEIWRILYKYSTYTYIISFLCNVFAKLNYLSFISLKNRL